MNNIELLYTDKECDLGVTLSHNFKWNSHISSILSKATQKLGLLKRVCSFTKNQNNRKILYLAIVRSQFEHCSCIWRPTTKSNLYKIEALQKRAIKWIFNQDYCCYSSEAYLNKLKQLKILPFELKFLFNDLVLFHSIVYKTSHITMPDYIVQYHKGSSNFQRETRSFNSNDELKFKCTVSPRIDAFANSFFHRTCQQWNSLPKELKLVESVNTFQSKLKEHLWLIADENHRSN